MNWNMKLSYKLLHFRIKIFLLILIFNKVANEEAGNLGLVDTTSKTHSTLLEDRKNAPKMNVNNDYVNDYDLKYPYEKLLALVNETKRILTSSNTTAEKRMLKLNLSDYEIYLRSNSLDGHIYRPDMAMHLPDFRISISTRAPPFENELAPMGTFYEGASPATHTCRIMSEVQKPKHLKSIDGSYQFILNLDNHFVQEWRVIKCFRAGEQCGSRSTWPEMYESVCEQNYSGTAKFFSVPVGQEITLSQQELREFKLPNGCNCKLRLETGS